MRSGFLALFFSMFFGLFATSAFADDPPKTPPVTPPATPPANLPATPPATVTLTKEQFDELMGRVKPKPPTEPPADDDPLRTKVKAETDKKAKEDADSKAMESAISFNLGLDKFVSDNKDLLPAEVAGVIRAGLSETYDTAAGKAAAIKVSVLQSYFAVQENVDLLTIGQKAELDNWRKLTKESKQDKAPSIYANIFEPALEGQRRVRKAEELNRGRQGMATTSGTEAAFRDKIIAASTKKYLGK